MVFKLLGGEAVKEAVTVKAKPKCVTCGHTNKATAKFCNKCGTALEIFA
jgi:tRNA(Ile2) C34 agmatinyltransferase TiaS